MRIKFALLLVMLLTAKCSATLIYSTEETTENLLPDYLYLYQSWHPVQFNNLFDPNVVWEKYFWDPNRGLKESSLFPPGYDPSGVSISFGSPKKIRMDYSFPKSGRTREFHKDRLSWFRKRCPDIPEPATYAILSFGILLCLGKGTLRKLKGSSRNRGKL